ncbi:MAG: DNA internalization-related competence protein ComEC/Rec2 [Desulfotomaculum sp. 46_296]|nr:MAG: DNA internalization-related competence protein ComEC/Rec2 [Desulfotomaculum sp. 46_296]
MASRPLLIFTCLVISGIVLSVYLNIPPGFLLPLLCIVFFAAVIGYLFSWRVSGIALILLFFLIGVFYGAISNNQVNPDLFRYTGHWVTLEGVVCSEPDLRQDKVIYKLDLIKIKTGDEQSHLKARVLVQAPKPDKVYCFGDLLRVHGLLVRPDEPGNPGEFNYRFYLARQGIGVILRAPGSEDFVLLGVKGNPFMRQLLLLKKKIIMVQQQTLPADKAALVNGIVFGTQGQIPEKMWEVFSQTGIVHILSVSGMHVGLVLAGAIALAKLLNITGLPGTLLISLLVILYSLFCGMGPAVSRSALMALMFLWSHRLGRKQDWPTTLSLAALIILLWKPMAIYDVGFQLSFSATWGILYLGPVISELLKKYTGWPVWIQTTIWVSLAAQLATLPLVALYYNIISPVSLLANILAVPLTTVILALGVCSGILGLFSVFSAGLINACTSAVLDVFTAIVSLLNNLPGSFISVPSPPLIIIPVWFIVLFFSARIFNKKNASITIRFLFEKRNALVITVVIAVTAILFFKAPSEKQLVMHMIDVGQGESILIQFPAGKNMLVDTGGWNGELVTGAGAGDKVVVPYLQRLGIHRLDALLLTHSHEDHTGGAAAVVKSIPVALIIVSSAAQKTDLPSGASSEEDPYSRLLEGFQKKGVNLRAVKEGDRLMLDPDVEIKVLGPYLRRAYLTDDENNSSVVLMIRYGRQKFLLTGDISVEAQEGLLKSGADLRADILKIPHHGSKLIRSFVERVHPSFALISVGNRNRFFLPKPETVKLLKDLTIPVYRTDKDGAIILYANGSTIRVKTGRGTGPW